MTVELVVEEPVRKPERVGEYAEQVGIERLQGAVIGLEGGDRAVGGGRPDIALIGEAGPGRRKIGVVRQVEGPEDEALAEIGGRSFGPGRAVVLGPEGRVATVERARGVGQRRLLRLRPGEQFARGFAHRLHCRRRDAVARDDEEAGLLDRAGDRRGRPGPAAGEVDDGDAHRLTPPRPAPGGAAAGRRSGCGAPPRPRPAPPRPRRSGRNCPSRRRRYRPARSRGSCRSGG